MLVQPFETTVCAFMMSTVSNNVDARMLGFSMGKVGSGCGDHTQRGRLAQRGVFPNDLLGLLASALQVLATLLKFFGRYNTNEGSTSDCRPESTSALAPYPLTLYLTERGTQHMI